MKRWLFGTFTAITTLTLAAGTAVACPVGGDGERPVRPIVRPIVDNVSAQTRMLVEQAGRMENAAMTREQSARTREMRADTLAKRARMLRLQVIGDQVDQASLVGFSDEQDVLSLADELAIRAATMRSRAAEDRAQASGLRMQARVLRERAAQLVRVGNGRGWRTNNKRVPSRDLAL